MTDPDRATVTEVLATPVIGRSVVLRLVELAGRAPSVYNTQPWSWRWRDGSLELWADRSRALTVADPTGRMLVISCGASLHHLQVAALAFGFSAEVQRLPDPGQPDLLARVRLMTALPPPAAAGELAALKARVTDRRRFTSWPVPVGRLERLAQRAEEWDCRAVAVGDVTDKFHLELLLTQALREQARDPAILAELGSWVDRSPGDGVPTSTVPDRPAPDESHETRFGVGTLVDDVRELDGSDGLVVLGDEEDSPAAWLRCGEGLSALALRATQEGLSVVPLSQVIEVPETRDALVHEVLHGSMVPLIVLRIGWQAISRSTLPPTPRRPVEDVLAT